MEIDADMDMEIGMENGKFLSASAIRLFEVGRYISASVSASLQDGGCPPNPQIRHQKICVKSVT
jgi:hypothetical protein